MQIRLLRAITGLLLAWPLWLGTGAGPLSAMEPPTKQQIEAYKADGSWERRKGKAKAMGNQQAEPALAQAAARRLQKLMEQGQVSKPSGTQYTPPSANKGLPTKGSPKIFVLLIDFSDFPADPLNTQAAVTARVFGDGDGVQAAPYESLKSYYYRSSYGQLTFTGNVLPYYRPAYTRASMGTAPTRQQRQALIQEALTHHAAQGHDFAQYDNDGDGKIESFTVLWTGPDTGWSEFWWAYQTNWSTSTPVVNGKALGNYIWQWFSNSGQNTRSYPSFDPKTMIHECGHALGLPDYYDYDDTVGPNGGLGGLDMMDGSKGDHNCFSKWLLDWITPSVYTSSTAGVSLRASGTYGDAALVVDVDPGNSFGEYYMVQNRQRVTGSNDGVSTYPGDGLLIWHVDARLNDNFTDFAYDNSYTSHKLLRMMEADGLESIELGERARAGCYYFSGKDFGPSTAPNSNRYDGTLTRMGVKNLSVAGPSMAMDVFLVVDPTAPTGSPSKPTGATALDTVTYTWTLGTSADADSGIAGYFLQVGTTPGGSDVFNATVGKVLTRTVTELGAWDGQTLYGRVAALNGAGLPTSWSDNSDGVTVQLPVFPGAVLDQGTLTFKTIGPWTTDTASFFSGSSSARSAVIGDVAKTYLQTKVTGPGTMDFYWKVRSEPDFDYLTFSIDGVDQPGAISGTAMTAFAKSAPFVIPAGAHLLRWTYAKDLNTAPPDDGAWVDLVTWSAVAVPTATVTPASCTAVTGSTVTYTAAVAGSTLNNVNWTVSPAGGAFSATTTAAGAPTVFTAGTTAGAFTVTATPAEAGGLAGTSQLTLVTPASVTVALTPSQTTASVNGPVTLTASVAPLSDQRVTWTCSGGSFSAQSGSGATWASPTAGTFTLTATSVAAPSVSNTTTVTVTAAPVINLVLTPATKTLLPGASFAFTVTGDLALGVDWSLTGAGATKVDLGTQSTLTVPAAAPLASLTFTLTAASHYDATRTASSTITVKGFDLNLDAAIDVRDLLSLAKEWGLGTSAAANLKGSGTVDDTDLNALLGKL